MKLVNRIINLTILECKIFNSNGYYKGNNNNKSNHIGM